MQVTVNGTITDINGANVTTTGTVKLNKAVARYIDGSGSRIVDGSIKNFSVTAGVMSVVLEDTANMESGCYYIFTIAGQIYKKSVPAATPVNFWNLPDVV